MDSYVLLNHVLLNVICSKELVKALAVTLLGMMYKVIRLRELLDLTRAQLLGSTICLGSVRVDP